MSGLSRTPGKRVWVNPHRGFESRPLRHKLVSLRPLQGPKLTPQPGLCRVCCFWRPAHGTQPGRHAWASGYTQDNGGQAMKPQPNQAGPSCRRQRRLCAHPAPRTCPSLPGPNGIAPREAAIETYPICRGQPLPPNGAHPQKKAALASGLFGSCVDPADSHQRFEPEIQPLHQRMTARVVRAPPL
jgi:hypothetical protein